MPVYDSYERSTFQGRDIRLYTFKRGADVYRQNSGDRTIAYGGASYVASPISDGGFKQNGEVANDDFVITVPLAHPVALAFQGPAPADTIKVTVRQIQFLDTEAPLIWTGYVSSARLREDSISAEIVCNTQVAYLARRGLRLTYMRQCPHALYDEGCKVNRDGWKDTGLVTELHGNNFRFVLADPPKQAYTGRYTAGYVEWQSEVGNYFERRAIQAHNDDYCELLNNSAGMRVGMIINLYPGCQLVPNNCKLFNNIPQLWGFIMMPGKSPFDGDPVF